MRILLVEDDTDLCDAMRFHLEREGYQVDVCHDGEDALGWIRQQAHGVIVLDRMLPGMDGMQILAKMRREQLATPVLMATALDGVGERVAGLDTGADDYLVKPFAVEELLARVRSLTRRAPQWAEAGRLIIGDIALDTTRHLAQRGERSVSLSKREMQLLEVFVRNPNQVLPRAVLFSQVWGPDAPVEETNLDSYIHFLRRRLRELGSGLRIRTVRSVGYRLDTGDRC